MQKRTFTNRIYKAVEKSRSTSHIYRDTDWRGLSFLLSDIEGVVNTLGATLTFNGSDYEGVLGECGHRKVYRYTISSDELKADIDVQIVAAFCGTMADPMGAYDLTLLMN